MGSCRKGELEVSILSLFSLLGQEQISRVGGASVCKCACLQILAAKFQWACGFDLKGRMITDVLVQLFVIRIVRYLQNFQVHFTESVSSYTDVLFVSEWVQITDLSI